MKINTQNFVITLFLGVGLVAPWPPLHQPASTKTVKFAVINDPQGEAIFSNKGLEVIARFPFGTYLGSLTSDSYGEFVEVATLNVEGTETAYFWVRKDRIQIIEGYDTIAAMIKEGTVKEKTDADIQKIFAAVG